MICGYSHFGTRPNRTSFLLHSRAVPIFPAGQQPTTALRRRGDMLQRLCNDHLGLRVDARRWIFVQVAEMDMDGVSWSFIGRCLACWLGISNMTISQRQKIKESWWLKAAACCPHSHDGAAVSGWVGGFRGQLQRHRNDTCWHLFPMLSAMGHEPDSVGLVGSWYGITSTN